jgi:hypothetical protein
MTASTPELELCDAQPAWLAVLAAYKAGLETSERDWLPRLFEVPEVPAEELAGVHGKLIAHGLLKVELGEKGDGLVYQLTPLSRHALIPADRRSLSVEAALAEREFETPTLAASMPLFART